MTAVFITLMIVIANVMGAGMAYPQASRLIRTGNTDGVSGIWAGVSLTMNLWWLAYGLARGLWVLVPVSAVAAVLYVAIVVTYARRRGVRASIGGIALGALVLGMVPLPFLLLGGWSGAGLAIGLCYGMQLVPAVVSAFRTRRLHGVAPSTWIMAWVEAVIWLGYGMIEFDVALLAGGVSGALGSSLILGRLAFTGHRPFALTQRRLAWA